MRLHSLAPCAAWGQLVTLPWLFLWFSLPDTWPQFVSVLPWLLLNFPKDRQHTLGTPPASDGFSFWKTAALHTEYLNRVNSQDT